MLEALAFFVYGLIFGTFTVGWCTFPWQTSKMMKGALSLGLGAFIGVLFAVAHMLINLQFGFMLQFGLPALLAMTLFFWAVRHEPGRPASQSNNIRFVFLAVILGLLGVAAEVLEVFSFWGIVGSLGGLVMLLEIIFSGSYLKSMLVDSDSEEGEPQRAPRGLPDNPLLLRAFVLLTGYGAGFAVWRNGPVLAWGFADVAMFIFNIGVEAMLLTLVLNLAGNKLFYRVKRGLFPTRVTLWLVSVSFVVAVAIPSFLSSPIFFWKQQAAVLGQTIRYASQADLVGVVQHSNEGRPRLPQAMADNIAHQRLGGAVGTDGGGSLGKTSKVEHYTMQTLTARFTARGSDGKTHELTYTHEPVFLAPLEPSGPLIQLMRGHTDGFVIIDANSLDQNNGHLVTHINGKPLEIKYHCNGGYFNANVRRFLYRHGYLHMGLSEGRFVLDPEGRPYCAVTGYLHATGFRTPMTVRMLLVDVQTGEIRTFDVGQQPAWIDQVYTPWMWEVHLNNWGTYREPGKMGNGWAHQVLDGTGVMHSSGEVARMEVLGRTMYFTTMTDGKSVTGYAIGDALTLQTTLYQMPNGGITEQRAQGQVISDDSAISNLFKTGSGKDGERHGPLPTISQPLPAVVDGRLVFQMVATNANGAPFRYAFVGIDAVGVTAVGRTYPEAMMALQSALEETVSATGERTVNTGRLKTMLAVNGKETEFWLYLDTFGGTAFVVPAKHAPWLPSADVGTLLHVVTVGKPKPDRRVNAVDVTRAP